MHQGRAGERYLLSSGNMPFVDFYGCSLASPAETPLMAMPRATRKRVVDAPLGS